MTTVINNPPPRDSDSDGGLGILLAAIILIATFLLFLIYGLPLLRLSEENITPQINVPEKIEININQGEEQ